MAGRASRLAACALLVLFAAGAVSARPLQAEPQANPTADPAAATIEAMIAKKTCSGHGKITEIKCWTDKRGFVTGVSFGDEREKESTVCDCHGEYATELELGEYESVVEIKACKGHKEEGYAYIEFITDGGRKHDDRLVCGSGHSDYDSGKAAKYGKDYKYAGSDGKEAGYKKDKDHDLHCETITNGKTPKWHKNADKKWYEEEGYTGEKYSAAGHTFDKASSFDPMTGQVCSDCKESPYYSEVHPLAELKGKCNKDGQLVKLSNACWNKGYKPMKKVVLEAELELFEDDESYDGYKAHCPSDEKLDELREWVAESVDHALEEHYISAKVKSGVLDCKPMEYGHNTTVKIIIEIFTKKDGKELHDLIHEYLGDYSENLCEEHAELGCDYKHVYSLELHEEDHVPKGVKLVGTEKEHKEGEYKDGGKKDKEYDGKDKKEYDGKKDKEHYGKPPYAVKDKKHGYEQAAATSA